MGCVNSSRITRTTDEKAYSPSSSIMEELPMIELIKTKEMIYVENIQITFREEYIKQKKKMIYNI